MAQPTTRKQPQEPEGRSVAKVLQGVRARLRDAGFEDDGLEAEALVSHALRAGPAWLYAHAEAAVGPASEQKVEELLGRRLNHEPLAYIRGIAYFYGREFEVDTRVLIPRPETELLVERALAEVSKWDVANDEPSQPRRIADIGTGSGILAITLALELDRVPGVEVQAVDVSADALEMATANAARHSVTGKIRLYQGDLGAPLTDRFQLIVANLPYIRSGDLAHRQPELSHEPRSALDGGEDGMRYVGRLMDDLPRLLARPGIALLEIDPPIAAVSVERARRAFEREAHTASVSVIDDLAGLERVLEISIGSS